MQFHSSARFSVGLLTVVAALVGCGGPPTNPPPTNGALTLSVTASPTAVPGLVVSSGGMQIDGLTVLGDVAPDSRSTVREFSLDLTSTKGAAFTLSMLPQGVYSRVRLAVGHVDLQGSWRGIPLHLQFETEDDNGAWVDLRAADSVELAPGVNAGFALSVDHGAWFAGNLLDSATITQSQILVDYANNASLTAQIVSRLPGSFALHDTATLR